MTLPCKYCVARRETTGHEISKKLAPVTADDCAISHRNDHRVYALALAMARAAYDAACDADADGLIDGTADERDADDRVALFLTDADRVVDDFGEPGPSVWDVRVTDQPANVERIINIATEHDVHITTWLTINNKQYVVLPGASGSIVHVDEFTQYCESWAARDERPQVRGYCPACGKTSLVLSRAGHIVCTHPECPHPTATVELLADGELDHTVVIDACDFTIHHPLRERLNYELLTCDLHAYISALSGPPMPPGWYKVKRDDAGGWTWDLLE